MSQTDGRPAPPTERLVTITTPYYMYFCAYVLVFVFVLGSVSLALEPLELKRNMYYATNAAALYAGYATMQHKLGEAVAKSLQAQLPYSAVRFNLLLTRFEADIVPSDKSASETNRVQYGRLELVGVSSDVEVADSHFVRRRQTYLVTFINVG